MATEYLESFILIVIKKQIRYSLNNDMIINKIDEESK